MRRSRLPARAAWAALAALVLAGCSAADERVEPSSPAASPSAPTSTASDSPTPSVPAAFIPELEVEEITDQLEHGWDIGFLPDGGALVHERLQEFLQNGSTKWQQPNLHTHNHQAYYA